jgi:outer membrane lipoprotein-sorting protein
MVKMPSKGSTAATTLHVCLIAMLMAGSSACLVRRRLITRKGGQPVQTLLTADKDSLIKKVAQEYAAIQSINATVDMAPALGTANKGKVTEYKDVRAYILFRKPAQIRIIGLYPVVRNKAFDMVSDGSQFSLYIPSKSRFIKGPNEIETPSPNKIENLRPQHFLEALLVSPVDPEDETFIENFTDADTAVYKLGIFAKPSDGKLILKRELWFDRLGLQLVRQLIFDPTGDILTDARYSEWKVYDAIPFPKHIEIDRPKDEYGVIITVVKMDINKPLTDDKFQLDQPPGTQLHVIGSEPEPPSPVPPPPAKKGKKKK